mmetsp:Transcript_11598/g.32384  ORF Transcript_11598/g.32384 Transcript_11598/m.32384 type:complete len:239 (-) Transcript_11598:1386-2102(-)
MAALPDPRACPAQSPDAHAVFSVSACGNPHRLRHHLFCVAQEHCDVLLHHDNAHALHVPLVRLLPFPAHPLRRGARRGRVRGAGPGDDPLPERPRRRRLRHGAGDRVGLVAAAPGALQHVQPRHDHHHRHHGARATDVRDVATRGAALPGPPGGPETSGAMQRRFPRAGPGRQVPEGGDEALGGRVAFRVGRFRGQGRGAQAQPRLLDGQVAGRVSVQRCCSCPRVRANDAADAQDGQ